MPSEGKALYHLKWVVFMEEVGEHVVFVDADSKISILLNRYKVNISIKVSSHYMSGTNTTCYVCRLE